MDSLTIATFTLVLITAYYAWQTHRTVTLLDKQLEKPVVVVDHFYIPEEPNDEDTHCIHSKLQNIGTGVAVGVLVEFLDHETDHRVGRSRNLIDFLKTDDSQSTHHIHIDHKDIVNFKYKEGHHGLAAELDCKISFQDVHGRKFTTTQMVYFKKNDRMIIPEPGTFRLN